MTENFSGAADGQHDGPRPPDESAAAAAGQPTDPQAPRQETDRLDPGRAGADHSAEPVGAPEAAPAQPVAAPEAGPMQAPAPSPWAPTAYPTYYGNPADSDRTQPVSGPQQTAYQPAGGYGYGPPTAAYPVIGGQPQPQQRGRGHGGLIAGIAVLALVVGGAAGGLGGYLVASRNDGQTSSVTSALDQPAPASGAAAAPAGSVQAVAQQLLPVVVEIAAEFPASGGANGDTGSGFIISSDGDILTNNHVIAQAATNGRIQVIFANGHTADATVVGRDPTTDVAVIKAKGVTGLPVTQLGRSDNLQVGQPVVAIGAPFQLSGTVTSGIVSSLHRPTAAGDGSQTSQQTVLDAIQTDAPINPGNSGGPLVDMQGRVIGINSAIYSPQSSSGGAPGGSQGGNVGIGFAIPIDQAKRTADQIVKTGRATQTVLGVKVTDNTPTSGGAPSILPNGALISEVTPGGPADKSGLKAGVVIVKANDRAVTSSDGLVAAVHSAAPGDQMKLTLSDGSTVTVTLSGQPVMVN